MRQSKARNKESVNSKLQTKRIDSEMNVVFKHAISSLEFRFSIGAFFSSVGLENVLTLQLSKLDASTILKTPSCSSGLVEHYGVHKRKKNYFEKKRAGDRSTPFTV